METIIELPEELLAKATRAAEERGVTRRVLVDRGLRRELGLAEDPSSPAEARANTVEAADSGDGQCSRLRVGGG
jgi:hypothetical protein